MDKKTFDKMTERIATINNEIDIKEEEIKNLVKQKSDILKSQGYEDRGFGIWILK